MVYLHLPSGAIWYGSDDQENKTINGLENFMCYYNMKPYDLLVFEYLGGPDFSIKIFNSYAVEINYGLKEIPFNYGICVKNHVGSIVDTIPNINEVKTDKLCATISYNANSTCSATFEMLIVEKHLERGENIEVLFFTYCYEEQNSFKF